MSGSNRLSPCAAVGCGALKADHLLMCVRHWEALPTNIREAVYCGHRMMQEGQSARSWLIARERARLYLAVRLIQPVKVIDEIEAEIERLENVEL